jgi:hypothetical protein
MRNILWGVVGCNRHWVLVVLWNTKKGQKVHNMLQRVVRSEAYWEAIEMDKEQTHIKGERSNQLTANCRDSRAPHEVNDCRDNDDEAGSPSDAFLPQTQPGEGGLDSGHRSRRIKDVLCNTRGDPCDEAVMAKITCKKELKAAKWAELIITWSNKVNPCNLNNPTSHGHNRASELERYFSYACAQCAYEDERPVMDRDRAWDCVQCMYHNLNPNADQLVHPVKDQALDAISNCSQFYAGGCQTVEGYPTYEPKLANLDATEDLPSQLLSSFWQW